MTSAIFIDKDIAEVCGHDLAVLKRSASKAALKRARICLHRDHGDAIQEMVIAFARGSYIRPHRHRDKVESIFIVEGALAVLFFDDAGAVTHRILLDREDANGTLMYRLSRDYWHTVIPLSEFVVIHEVTQGPFCKEDNYAPWSPRDDERAAVAEFLAALSGAP